MPLTKEMLAEQIEHLREEEAAAWATFNQIVGARRQCEHLLKLLEREKDDDNASQVSN